MIAPRRFWLFLALLVVATVTLLVIMHFFLPDSSALSQFAFWCVCTFTVINVFAYYSGKRAANSKSKFRFVQLMMILVLFKMMICVALVVAYVKINQPESKLFILPFFMIYLIFTLFEIYILEKLARSTSTTSAPSQPK